jgi:integral membrane protein
MLFIAYIILAVILGSKLKWKSNTLLFILAASIIPFGTFYVDKVYLKKVS